MAIKLEELRIGNWVNAPKLVVLGSCKSSECNDMINFQVPYLTQTDHQIKLYEPIPLTPDILIACGFENVVDDIEWGLPDHSFYVVRQYGSDYFRHYKTTVMFLHQLQNLYFALTGDELIYKP